MIICSAKNKKEIKIMVLILFNIWRFKLKKLQKPNNCESKYKTISHGRIILQINDEMEWFDKLQSPSIYNVIMIIWLL